MLLARDQLTTPAFLNQRAKKHLHSFVVVNGEFTKTLKKVDSSSIDSCCLIYGINFKSVRVRGGMSLWHGMRHDLRNGIIMWNVILAE